ncbi:MAG: hypothetical protein H7A45_16210 [Verrucomicrobiales bacterium]|nr:hypothetical protein [Verrucomicrobiales bacterium]
MMDPFLEARLRPVLGRQRRRRTALRLSGLWLAVGLLAVAAHALLAGLGWRFGLLPWAAGLVGFTGTLLLLTRGRRRGDEARRLVLAIERRHPELDGRLLTASEQAFSSDREPSFLRRRLVDEVMDHAAIHRWTRSVPWWQVAGSQLLCLAAVAGVLWMTWRLPPIQPGARVVSLPPSTVEVSPGNIELEKGSSLVVMARFGEPVPAQVTLISRASRREPRSVALVKSLSDPMFGGSIPNVEEDLSYRLEFDDRRTEDYRVTVFEYPALTRADAGLVYPDYTAQEPRKIEDVRRISAVEGTRLTLELKFNKPVTDVRLLPEKPVAESVVISPGTNAATALLPDFALTSSRTYFLQLTDADGRTNKSPTRFVLNVLTNRPPELRLAAPRGDLRPSAIEEVRFDGTVWDDFGVRAHGLAYMRAGESPAYVTLGEGTPARAKQPFDHLLPLEELRVAPDELVCWFVWADDVGPDGELRRTTGDLYFAEIRPFDEVFREGQAQTGQQSQQSEQSGQQDGQQSPSTRLAELQKQIISATWNIQRASPGRPPPAPDEAAVQADGSKAEDLTVIRDSQADALAQAEGAREEAGDGRTAGFWATAIEQMGAARDALDQTIGSGAPLDAALSAEQAAYQALLRLQQREYEVARSQRQQQRGQNANNRQQQMQRQLDQLDLTQSENRYETESQAQAPQSDERREQLQVLNRLSELARRQEDVNQRLRELQTALQEARTEQEREELRRELKRLQEEEQRLVADLDELQQRLDRPENQSRMAEQRQQLEETREEMRRAAEAAGEGQPSQALASGSRAQRQMQEMREDLRRESAGAFAEDLRRMRAEARELVREQESLGQALDGLDQNQSRRLTDEPRREALLDRLDEQRERLTNLVEQVRTVSEQAEQTEPLVSSDLYDSLRRFSQEEARNVKEFQDDLLARGMLTRSLYDRLQEAATDDEAKSLTLTSEMLRQGLLDHADEAERRARAGIDTLAEGVTSAAEKVLGDDTEALRFAQSEIDALTRQVEREIDQARASEAAGERDGRGSEARDQPGAEGPRGRSGEAERQASQPGEAPRAGAGSSDQGTPGDNEQAQGEPTPELARNDADRPPASRGENGREQPGQGGGQGGGQTGEQVASQADREPAPDTPREGNRGGRGGRLPEGFDWLLGGNDQSGGGTGPITGLDFAPWSDRLREVEETVDLPTLRSQIARTRERAGELRREFRDDLKKPDWVVVQLEIVKPLVEVRDLIREELARRDSTDELAPIDRDPVPGRYTELVRRYYEELGRDGRREAAP